MFARDQVLEVTFDDEPSTQIKQQLLLEIKIRKNLLKQKEDFLARKSTSAFDRKKVQRANQMKCERKKKKNEERKRKKQSGRKSGGCNPTVPQHNSKQMQKGHLCLVDPFLCLIINFVLFLLCLTPLLQTVWYSLKYFVFSKTSGYKANSAGREDPHISHHLSLIHI